MLKASFFSRRILYKPSLILLFQPMMALQKPFHVPKSSFWTPRLLGVSARLLLEPLSIGRLRAGRLGAPVNSGLADRQAGNPCKHWAGGQPLRKRPFYAGCGAGGVRVFGRGGYSDDDASPRRVAPIRSGYFCKGSWWLLERDGGGWFSGCIYAVPRAVRRPVCRRRHQ